jgi:hypothetical protein
MIERICCSVCENLPIRIKIPGYKAMSISGIDRPETEIILNVNYCPNCGRKLSGVQYVEVKDE